MKKIILTLMISILPLLLPSQAGAEQAANQLREDSAVLVFASMPTTDLTQDINLYIEEAAEIEFPQLLQESATRLQPLARTAANFGFSHSAYWVSLKLHNPKTTDAALMIRQDYPLIDYVDFWDQDLAGVWRATSTGDRRVFDARAVGVRDFLFPVTVPANSDKTVYFRFKSDGPMNIGLSIADTGHTLSRVSGEQLLFGAYYGGFLVLVIYNLILFLAVKDRAYIYYMVYVVSYGLYMSVHNGFAFQYIWPNSPWLANQSLLLLLGVSLLFGLKFSRVVCSTQHWVPRTDRIAVVLQVVTATLLLVTPFLGYQDLIFAYSLLTVLVCFCILLLGSLVLLRGSVPARYFMVAWATLLVSVLIYMFKQFGFLPHNFVTQNSFQMGSLLEMVLLSLALSARVNEMQKLGYSDALTALANRRHFDEVLPREIDKAKRTKKPLSLIVIDIDNFKAVNDDHGHTSGDEVIEELGRILRKHVRRPTLACRYGGEEFAVLVPNTGMEQAGVLAERLRCLVKASPIKGLHVTISLGVACCTEDALDSPSALFEAADTALYQAKHEGKDRVCFYQLPELARRTDEAQPATS
ncbi:diguanylate cyclase [Simiduia curdlanivorans]|uniref:diguanylate cyclase n=1 Tax=Simiduia curdlanivorans TaxID=1492769 RepID=A0ABV8V357_9GAMM|nr:diguanylate cyclase [Simiduia curdlanivorans]MDN3637687.1 diguanylate cyclase [Simiduia curdlanivorans]